MTRPINLRSALAMATCSLLGAGAANAGDGEWQIDTALLYYGETDRVSAVEPVVSATHDLGDEETLNIKLVLDGLTGPSANGAQAEAYAQTFTTPSGNQNYTVPAGEVPLDEVFHDTRGALSGPRSGTRTGGPLLLGATDVLNDNAPLGLSGGTFSTGGFSEGDAATAGLGSLSLSATSTLDFGGATGSTLAFAGLGSHTGGALLLITNWDASSDRLLFAGLSSSFTGLYPQEEVSFNSVPGYAAIQFDAAHFEIIAIPEPSSTALIGAASLLGLVGFRERRRYRRLASSKRS